MHAWTHLVREPGDPRVALGHSRPHREVSGRTAMTNDPGKSDRFVVPVKSPNTAPERAVEVMEGRGRAKGNTPERNAPGRRAGSARPARLSVYGRWHNGTGHSGSPRSSITSMPSTQLRSGVSRGEAGRGSGHRWRDVAALGAELEARLQALSERLRQGRRAQPVRRAYIPKADGRPAAARRSRAGRQDRPACRRRGVTRSTNRTSSGFVRVSAAAQPASRVGCAYGRDHGEESELGARRGHPELL